MNESSKARLTLWFSLLFLAALITRLCHSGIVWVEEAYPATAAIQILNGKWLYRDFWFDKPPLTPLLYLLWGARTGVILRLAGALFVVACCWAAYRLARELWSEREGLTAAGLLAFYLTFDVPSAVMALAPDLVTVLPHLLAVYLAWKGRAFLSGVAGGVAFLANPKGAFVLAACLLWSWREWLPLMAGFAAVNVLSLAVLEITGALPGYYRQVWKWGALYSRDTFLDQPFVEGLRRSGAWLGFHSAITLAAAWYFRKDPSAEARRLAVWAAIALVGVLLGWRFFPRYYFLLLPPVIIAASRGFTMLPKRARIACAALLLIPLIRFGPRYLTLASGLLRGLGTPWADVAMNGDSREVAGILSQQKHPRDTLLVWGYRPDIFVYTRMTAGTPFLDSQPLTGVIADRHLSKSEASAPELAAQNRRELTLLSPNFIVDGLGGYNPRLAITSYPDLTEWLGQYELVAHTGHSAVYRLRQ